MPMTKEERKLYQREWRKKNPEKSLQYSRKWTQNNRKYYRDYRLKKNYLEFHGTLKGYDEMTL